MVENVVDQIVAELRGSAARFYPERGEERATRIVGHTPKNDHFIYDICIDFALGSERVAAKVYRTSKCGQHGARTIAKTETENVAYIYSLFSKKHLCGVPRSLGDFSSFGAVVTEKISGLPIQSMIMKAALLPGYADHGTLQLSAQKAGEWLRNLHRLSADVPEPFDPTALLSEIETLCVSCRGEGLDDAAIRTILIGARQLLSRSKKVLPASVVLNDFTPLNLIVTEDGVGVSDYARMSRRGMSFYDVALFLASVEALEKYPFCNRSITAEVQDAFLEAYGAAASERAILRVLKMKVLLGMFAQGRGVKESAVRKKVMWATVMKRFIQQAAQRSMCPAA
jgi:Phosphotransferase enzyme family